MKIILILALALSIGTNVMAVEPATPAPTEVPGAPEAAGVDDKALVDQNHKPESGTLEQHADKVEKKKFKKNKRKNSKKKNHGAHKKHRKNKKSQA